MFLFLLAAFHWTIIFTVRRVIDVYVNDVMCLPVGRGCYQRRDDGRLWRVEHVCIVFYLCFNRVNGLVIKLLLYRV